MDRQLNRTFVHSFSRGFNFGTFQRPILWLCEPDKVRFWQQVVSKGRKSRKSNQNFLIGNLDRDFVSFAFPKL